MKDDYDLSELIELKVRGLKYFVMPRYKHHYEDNEYEDFSLDIMLEAISADSTVVDIGSHYGIYSLSAAKRAKQGEVIAIEPVKENYTVLQKNISANKLTNVIAHNYAASDKNGVAEFNIPWASDSAGFYEHPNAETIRRVQVKMAAPDELIKSKKVDFIKIDTEGHELHVLDGLSHTLASNPQAKILVEFNPQCLINAGFEPIDLLLRLKKLNKTLLIVDEQNRKLINITDQPEAWSQYVESSGYANIYSVPIEGFAYALVVSPSAHPGGAELALVDLIDDLRHQNVISHFIVPEEGFVTKVLKDMAIGYSIVPFGGWVDRQKLSTAEKMENDAWNFKAATDITDLATELNPGLIISNTIISPWAAVAASATAKPHLWMIHEYGNLDHGLVFDYGYDETLRIIDRLSDQIVVNSPNLKNHLEKIISSKKIYQMYYRFIPEKIEAKASEKERQIFTGKTALKVMLVGRIIESKGQLTAVMAVAELKKQGIKVELKLIGAVESKAYKAEIDKAIKQHGLAGMIEFIDHVDNVLPYMAQTDVVLMCSKNEAFGRVTAEAMSLGKPVIGTNTGATKYLIEDGVTGLLYKPEDSQDLAAKMATLSRGKTKITTMGAKAKQRATTMLSTDRHIKSIKSLINDQIIKNKTTDPNFLYDKFINGSRIFNKKIGSLDKTRNEMQLALEDLQRQNDDIRTALDAIHNSKSWKTARALAKTKHVATRIVKPKK